MVGFWRDCRGASEAISFIGIIMVLMLVVMNTLPPLQAAIQYARLAQVHRDTLLRME